MQIRFLKSYRGYQEGRSYECPDGAALILIQRKIAQQINEEPDAKSAKKQPKSKAASSTETVTA